MKNVSRLVLTDCLVLGLSALAAIGCSSDTCAATCSPGAGGTGLPAAAGSGGAGVTAGTSTGTYLLDLATGTWTNGPTNAFGSSGYAESSAMYAPGKIIRSGGGDPSFVNGSRRCVVCAAGR